MSEEASKRPAEDTGRLQQPSVFGRRPSVPPDLEADVLAAAFAVRQKHKGLLNNPEVARSAGNLFVQRLRRRRKPGPKLIPSVTEARRILNSVELASLPQKQRWCRIYPRVIPGWEHMTPEERSGAASVLRGRVYSRERTRKKRRTKT